LCAQAQAGEGHGRSGSTEEGGAHIKSWRPQTRAVRGGLNRSNFDETSAGAVPHLGLRLHSAEEAEATFKGESTHFQYSRFGNPPLPCSRTASRRWKAPRLVAPPRPACRRCSSRCWPCSRTGDRIVAARQLFGSCHYIVNELLPKYGITGEFVDGGDLKQWEKALAKPTQAGAVRIAQQSHARHRRREGGMRPRHKAGAKVVLDNAFATPMLQRPLEFGADIVVHSATKYIDGQGRTLGGAILGSREFIIDKLQPIIRNTGPSMSPFNAWVLVKGLETLGLRIDRHCANAAKVADALAAHPAIGPRALPGPSRPSAAQARGQPDVQFSAASVTFDVKAGKWAAFETLNRLKLIDISNKPRRRQEHGHPIPPRRRTCALAPKSGPSSASATALSASRSGSRMSRTSSPTSCRRSAAKADVACPHLVAGNADWAQKILAHPFVRGLGDGSLPVAAFKGYVAQDAYFSKPLPGPMPSASPTAPRARISTDFPSDRGRCSRS